jgi:hypothetical protein
MEFQKAKILSIRDHPELTEKWLQGQLVKDPTLLGLGDLTVKDVERKQPHAGRLDLLLVDPDSLRRYEVELQLGATDESHIIRTLEYWDIERRRYPMYEHVAVLVAERVTSRFLNVISLFNGFIPIMAIQLQLLEVGGVQTLSASTVVDVMSLGTEEEEEEAGGGADRGYWQEKAPAGLLLADQLLVLVQETDPKASLKYNKHFIGIAHDGVPDHYVIFRPRLHHLGVGFRIPRSDELTEELEQGELDFLRYDPRAGRYFVRLTESDIRECRSLLVDLIKRSRGAEDGL